MLATSPPLLALQIRAPTAEATPALLAALRHAPVVAQAEVAGLGASLHPDSLAPPGRVPAPDAPIYLVTLRADSIGMSTGTPADSVTPILERAVRALRQVYDFEVLDLLVPLPILRVRPWQGGDGVDLTIRLGGHRWVRAVEPDVFVVDSGGPASPD